MAAVDCHKLLTIDEAEYAQVSVNLLCHTMKKNYDQNVNEQDDQEKQVIN